MISVELANKSVAAATAAAAAAAVVFHGLLPPRRWDDARVLLEVLHISGQHSCSPFISKCVTSSTRA